jgi:hypothetical protein
MPEHIRWGDESPDDKTQHGFFVSDKYLRYFFFMQVEKEEDAGCTT